VPDQPALPDSDTKLAARLEVHEELQSAIENRSDAELERLLSASEPLLRDGRDSISLAGTDAPVFVKLVPLSAFELEPQNRESTSNLFRVPASYQYRHGGFGCGAWREIEAHEVANGWVLAGQCAQFPLLHGWRVVPIAHPDRNAEWRTKPWGDDPIVGRRSAAMAESTHSAALFLEPFPQNLLQWALDRPPDAPDPSVHVWETEARGLDLLAFTNAQDVLHMDAHFENILTDGNGQLYLTDWGLTLSRTFDLSSEERDLFGRHENYDRCTFITSLVHSVTSHLYPKGEWLPTLQALLDGTDDRLARLGHAARDYVTKRGPVAVAYTDFYRRLMKDRSTEYPAAELDRLLDGA
jgi:hypothetical protein